MYRYHPPPPPPHSGLLPDDDYVFTVGKCDLPYKSTKGNLVLPLRLTILPERVTVFANPWCGTDKNGEHRDSIAEFLLCIGHAPQEGQEPDWTSIVGAKGRCRLKSQVAERGKLAGQEVNVVAWFHRPAVEEPTKAQSFSKEEYAKLLKDQAQAARRGGGGSADKEPDSIPFRSTIYRDIKSSRLSRRPIANWPTTKSSEQNPF